VRTAHKADFRICQYSVQANHLHLICEPRNVNAMTRGIIGFKASCARRLNALAGRKGPVFDGRYHARYLTSPIEVRRALCYVLNNWRRHREDWRSKRATDPFSSAACFDRWAEELGQPSSGSGPPESPPVAAATFWLLTTGWRRHGAIRHAEVPGGQRADGAAIFSYMTADGIRVIAALDAVRLRPQLYIGEATHEISRRARLVSAALSNVIEDTPAPSAVRLLLWRCGAITIALDGEPLPIGPVARGDDDVSHPELYGLFMALAHSNRRLTIAGPVLNALSEHLVVSTMVDGQCYRATFSRGGLVGLLHRVHLKEPLGATWLTFRPDPEIITGELDLARARTIVEAVSTEAIKIELQDRTDVDADWR
jgi:hypothetical protein